MTPELDIVIPVYNEGHNIVAVLAALKHALATPARVLICYDHAEDDTLPAIRANADAFAGLPVELGRNAGRGGDGASMTGFPKRRRALLLTVPADHQINAAIPDHFLPPPPCERPTRSARAS